jgi:predicted RNA-binding protein YlxR (DUF448 family)
VLVISEKRLPIRMCVGCRKREFKFKLLRIVQPKSNFGASNDNVCNDLRSMFIDRTGRGLGRGFYLCKNSVCLEKLKRSKKFRKTLSSKTISWFFSEIEGELASDV